MALFVLTAPTLGGCTVMAWYFALEQPEEPNVRNLIGPADGGGTSYLVVNYGTMGPFTEDVSGRIPLRADGTPDYPFGFEGTPEELAIPARLSAAQCRAVRRTDFRGQRAETKGQWLDGHFAHWPVTGAADEWLKKQGLIAIAFHPGMTWKEGYKLRPDDGHGNDPPPELMPFPPGTRVVILPRGQPRPPLDMLHSIGWATLITPATLVGDAVMLPAELLLGALGFG
jgi:hypothetical protein